MPRIALFSTIVILFLPCLMPGIQPAAAAELYRWVEADGSISFSRTPPAAGTNYEIVSSKKADTAPEVGPAEPALSAAVRSRKSGSVPATRQSQASGNPAALIADGGKSEHCRELAKRVVSLERRLTTPLTPRQMDDTVVYMARYQRSIDQFCSG